MSDSQSDFGASGGETRAGGRISSRFGRHATAMEVLADQDLRGRTAIVTGGASGVGFEAARALASAGASVTIAARNLAAATAAAASINGSLREPRVTVGELDLGDIASIRRFSDRWGDEPLGILVNNAGVMASPEGTTKDGFEVHFGTNHLGHFLLAVLLTPALKRGAPSRMISLSSSGHMRSGIDFEDPHFRHRPYDPLLAYGQSKTANALFAVEFDRRHRTDGIRAFSVMPGMIRTNLLRHINTDELAEKFGLGQNASASADAAEAPSFRTPGQGAATIVWAAVSPDLDGVGGLYLQDCAEAPPFEPGMPRGQGVQPHALDPRSARALWELSERELGIP